MNFVFEQRPWDEALEKLEDNIGVSALQLLDLLEQADEEETEQFLDSLAKKNITIDVTTLPKTLGIGAVAARLRLEEKMVRQGDLIQDLEENDPLRLYLEELIAPSGTQLPAGAENKDFNAMLEKAMLLAQEYVGMGVLLLDLIQEANLGLWQGVQSFQDGDFEAHWTWWSRHYLSRAVLLQAKASGVGQKLRQATEDYRAVDEKLLAELGRNPTTQEIAEALHMTVAETEAVAEMLDSAKLIARVKTSKQEEIPQEEDQAVEDTAYFQMRQRIQELLSVLSEEDANLLTLRFGLEGGIPLKPEQVAQKMGITVADVAAREAAALSKLRKTN